jgi:hypothetical protein
MFPIDRVVIQKKRRKGNLVKKTIFYQNIMRSLVHIAKNQIHHGVSARNMTHH